MRSLTALLEHETMGQQARFERFMAEMMYVVAAGRKIDTAQTERFGRQVEEVYKNPFNNKESAEAIKQRILKKLGV